MPRAASASELEEDGSAALAVIRGHWAAKLNTMAAVSRQLIHRFILFPPCRDSGVAARPLVGLLRRAAFPFYAFPAARTRRAQKTGASVTLYCTETPVFRHIPKGIYFRSFPVSAAAWTGGNGGRYSAFETRSSGGFSPCPQRCAGRRRSLRCAGPGPPSGRSPAPGW